MKQNAYFSYNQGKLPRGCQLCVKGRKTVIYITGLCPRRCYYCPLSQQRQYTDIQFANERPIKTIPEIIEEVKCCDSTGAGITGGDPLSVLPRTVKTIIALKKEFGSSFHIHLYTSLNLISEKTLTALYSAGLDEIRVHPDLDDQKLWPRISLLALFDWETGIEIPAIPGKSATIKKLITTYHDSISYMNLNELELSPKTQEEMNKRGYFCKNNESYAIKGSLDMAKRLVTSLHKQYPKLTFHACTGKLKDKVQLSNRFKLRAKKMKLPLDYIAKDGLFMRGVIKTTNIDSLQPIIKEFNIPKKLIAMDEKRNQILIAPWVLYEIHTHIPYKTSVVSEYPTWDRPIIIEEDLE